MTAELTTSLGPATVPVEGGETTCQIDVEAESTSGNAAVRRHVVFCVDVSASMRGDKLEQAKRGMKRGVENLSDDDYVGVVSFESDPDVELAPVRYGDDERAVKDVVGSLEAGGGTDVLAALRRAREQFDAMPDEEALQWIVLVSDGKDSKRERINSEAESCREDAGIAVQAAGVGEDSGGLISSYDERIIRGVAEASMGQWRHVPSASGLADFFEEMLERSGSVVEVDPTLTLSPRDGVERGDVLQRQDQVKDLTPASSGEVTIDLEDISAEEPQRLLVELTVPGGEAGTTKPVLDVTLETGSESAAETAVVEYGSPLPGIPDEQARLVDTRARALAMDGDADGARAALPGDQVFDVTRDEIDRIASADDPNPIREDLSQPDMLAKADDDAPTGGSPAEDGEATPGREDEAAPDEDDEEETVDYTLSVALDPSTVAPGDPLTVRVHDEDGGRVEGATVTAGPDAEATTDIAGTATVQIGSPGSYEVEVTGPDGERGHAEVTVREP